MIAIRYKCHCMDEEAEIEVPNRPSGGDILIWMNVVQATIGMDHSARAPRCMATEMEYAKIPVDERAEELGGKPRLAS